MNTTAVEVPVISDIQSGMNYLSQLSLANPIVAERQLMSFIESLLVAPPDSGVLLALLEQARAPMCFVEEEMARRYHNRALPLADEEESYFQQVVTAWRKMGKAYALCAQREEPDSESAQYLSMMATILHRCLYYTGMVILEHYRARRDLPPGIWLDLHGFYETAEEWGIAYTPVEDALETACKPPIVPRLTRRCCSSTSPAPTATACATSTSSGAGPACGRRWSPFTSWKMTSRFRPTLSNS